MLVLRNARVVDGRGVRHERADLVLADGRIERISADRLGADAEPGAADLDVAGRTVVPGLMNAHSHSCLDGSPDPEALLRTETTAETAVRSAARLKQTLLAGVTTVREVGAPGHIDISLSRLQARGEIPGPRMLCAGNVIAMTGGHGWWMGAEADGPDEVRKAVRTQIKAGATAIKLMATGGMMTPNQQAGAPQLTVEEMRAGCEEAHKAGFPVGAHSESKQGCINAILAGVDSIEHGHGIDEEVVALMLEHGTAIVPTILSDVRINEAGTDAGIPAFVVEKCRPLFDQIVRAVQACMKGGVPIAAGNDGGAPLVLSGDMVDEIALYVRYGMKPLDALATATINTARLFRVPELGHIEEGWIADLLVVQGDPLESVEALRAPEMVVQAGRLIEA